ncbi:MAG: cytochrome P450 [Sciscionella sp.]
MSTTESPLDFPFPNSTFNRLDERYAWLRADRPVARVTLDTGTAWLVTRYDDVHAVLTDRRFSLAEAIKPAVPKLGTLMVPDGSILAMDPPEHTRLRGLVTKVFTARRIEEMRPDIQRIVDRLLGQLAEMTPPVDLIEHFAAALPIEIICELLGVPTSDRHDFQEWGETVLAVSGRSMDEVMLAWQKLGEYLAVLVADKRRNPKPDLLSDLVAARDARDALSEQEMIVFAFTLLVAGYETTKNQLAASLVILRSRYPEQWQRLVRAPELVIGAVDELLRYVPLFGVGVSAPRVALEDVRLGGAEIRAGEVVLASLPSANRDETVFSDAEQLDVERGTNRHLAFGIGVHRCLGAQLARLELELGLRGLLCRFPSLDLAVPEDELHWRTGNFIIGLHTLPVTW